MTLNKVRETLQNDEKSEVAISYERKFDVIVKIIEINNIQGDNKDNISKFATTDID